MSAWRMISWPMFESLSWCSTRPATIKEVAGWRVKFVRNWQERSSVAFCSLDTHVVECSVCHYACKK